MKLKGDWKGNVGYSVGDVLRYTDGKVYHLQRPCSAGVPPVNTLYWGEADAITTACALFALDAVDMAASATVALLEDDLTQSTAGKKALDAHQGKVLDTAIKTVDGKVDALVIPTNISDDAITLKDASDNEYLITVDGSGDTPELVVTAVTAEVSEGT